ncbi:MAG: hypothetical protein RL701_76 [Pseudomonadota bacterium]
MPEPEFSAELRPYLLAPDNFTPPARTPWGGRRIAAEYKAAVGLAAGLQGSAVGESWELSFGPELPSRTVPTGNLEPGPFLYELARANAPGFLGEEAKLGASALLVKWLDAADDLSVQIHPDLSDPGLASDETGKPECWYIVAADPGAGVYLGLQAEVDASAMRHALETGADVSRLLRFQPVTPGDFFLLPPGLPHAVGRGVTMIEPQYIYPGKKGVTLRYWDWNRRYDANGKLDAGGRSRELHVERAIAVTDWVQASDPAWLARKRSALGPALLTAAASCQVLCGSEASCAVVSNYLRAARLSGTGSQRLPDWGTLRALTVIDGAVTLRGAFGEVRVPRGITAALPAGLVALEGQLEAAHAIVSSVVPFA